MVEMPRPLAGVAQVVGQVAVLDLDFLQADDVGAGGLQPVGQPFAEGRADAVDVQRSDSQHEGIRWLLQACTLTRRARRRARPRECGAKYPIMWVSLHRGHPPCLVPAPKPSSVSPWNRAFCASVNSRPSPAA